MKPAPFTYHDPSTVGEAAAILGQFENARPLAGGQSLVPMMNFRYAAPDHIVDLNRITELQTFSVGSRISIGSMTRQRAIEFSPEMAQACPILVEALRNVGHRQTRNRGTLGGSLCHLDPAAETPAVMMLHDAELTAQSAEGKRTLPMSEFALGFMTTSLDPGDILTGIAFDAWPQGHGFGFEEYARRHGDFAIASCGVLLTLDESGAIARFSAVVGGLAPVPARLADFEASAIGVKPDADFAKAFGAAAAAVEAMDDAHVSASYRQHLAGVLAGRALRKALARVGGKGLQNG
jgi:carbon-monoxide dehydrogenase medium subunit